MPYCLSRRLVERCTIALEKDCLGQGLTSRDTICLTILLRRLVERRTIAQEQFCWDQGLTNRDTICFTVCRVGL